MHHLPHHPLVRITGRFTPIDVVLARDLLARQNLTLTERRDLPADAIVINDWNCLASNVGAIVEARFTLLPVIIMTALARKADLDVMRAAGARVVRKPSGILTLPFVVREEISAAAARSRRFAWAGRP